jgi:hypothetical protein
MPRPLHRTAPVVYAIWHQIARQPGGFPTTAATPASLATRGPQFVAEWRTGWTAGPRRFPICRRMAIAGASFSTVRVTVGRAPRLPLARCRKSERGRDGGAHECWTSIAGADESEADHRRGVEAVDRDERTSDAATPLPRQNGGGRQVTPCQHLRRQPNSVVDWPIPEPRQPGTVRAGQLDEPGGEAHRGHRRAHRDASQRAAATAPVATPAAAAATTPWCCDAHS